jgi:hypothetical protein
MIRIQTDGPAKVRNVSKERVEMPAKRSKADAVFEKLSAGWVAAADLMAMTGWQPHTLRGALSTMAKKRGVTIERQRENDVTSYRVKQ